MVQVLLAWLHQDIGNFKRLFFFHKWPFLVLALLVFVDVFYTVDLFVFFNNYFFVRPSANLFNEVGLASLTSHLVAIFDAILGSLQVYRNVLTAECNPLTVLCKLFRLVERHVFN